MYDVMWCVLQGYTFIELLRRVQSSREELFKGLVGLSAIAINGECAVAPATYFGCMSDSYR